MSIFALSACTPQADQSHDGEKLKIVATTSIVGDVVSQVGGDAIDLLTLLPLGADPHSFDSTPQDIVKVAEADLVFANGAGLEAFLDKIIESAGATGQVVDLSAGIDFLALESDPDHQEDEHNLGGMDPHTWTDPNNVLIWVETIADKLGEYDPANATIYIANAATYRTELENLDAWIRTEVAQIPPGRRQLVTDHTLFGYFADEYDFVQVGALIPGFSTLAEPSAKELAAIEDAIRSIGVKAIFVGHSVNPTLAERVVTDTGTQLVYIYTGSLSKPGGGAATYLEYMRYNTTAFVEALK